MALKVTNLRETLRKIKGAGEGWFCARLGWAHPLCLGTMVRFRTAKDTEAIARGFFCVSLFSDLADGRSYLFDPF